MRDLGKELQAIVRDAAAPIEAGMSIQAQINKACENLGYPRGHWRVVKAWYGLAGNWQGRAVFELMDRYNRYERRMLLRQNANDLISAAGGR